MSPQASSNEQAAEVSERRVDVTDQGVSSLYSTNRAEPAAPEQEDKEDDLEQAVEWLLRKPSSSVDDRCEVQKEKGLKAVQDEKTMVVVSLSPSGAAVESPIVAVMDPDEQRESKPAINAERIASFADDRSDDEQEENGLDGSRAQRVLEPLQSDVVEQWLTRGLRSWQRQEARHDSNLTEDNAFPQLQRSNTVHSSDKYLSREALSSTSSHSKTSLRARMENRLAINRRTHRHCMAERWDDSLNHTQEDLLDTTLFGAVSDDEEEDRLPTSPMSDSGLPMHNSNHRQTPRPNARPEDDSNVSYYRLSRTVRYGRRGEMPTGHSNIVRLHIYDLVESKTVMMLPFGCEFPIGQCFEALNNGLYALGTGAYHCGVEVNGIEYGYGANDIPGNTGVFSCIPKHSPGYGYRATIDFGSRVAKRVSWVAVETNLVNTKTGQGRPVSNHYEQMENSLDGACILRQMALEYKGTDYDLLRRNCCTFARDACLRLGVQNEEIPSWFLNLANAGGNARDAATCFAFRDASQPQVAFPQQPPTCHASAEDDCALGFEAILEDQKTNVLLVDATTLKDPGGAAVIGVRRTTSWTY